MRTGSLKEWADHFNCGPDDLPAVAGHVLRQLEQTDESIIRMRMAFHAGPDTELNESLLRLERASANALGHLGSLHDQFRREIC